MKRLIIIAILSIVLAVLWFFSGLPDVENTKSVQKSIRKSEAVEKCYIYGYDPDSFAISCGIIAPNEFLADILLPAGVSYSTIDAVAKASIDVFDVRNLRSGGTYTLVAPSDSAAAIKFIYQNSPYFHVIYDLEHHKVELVKEDIVKHQRIVSGTIDGSLWLTMDRLHLPYELIYKMEQSLAWSVDFYHVQPEDSFKLIYEEERIDGAVEIHYRQDPVQCQIPDDADNKYQHHHQHDAGTDALAQGQSFFHVIYQPDFLMLLKVSYPGIFCIMLINLLQMGLANHPSF